MLEASELVSSYICMMKPANVVTCVTSRRGGRAYFGRVFPNAGRFTRPGFPMLGHHGPRKLIVLGVELVRLVAINEMDDVDGLVRHLGTERGHARIAPQLGWQLLDQVG